MTMLWADFLVRYGKILPCAASGRPGFAAARSFPRRRPPAHPAAVQASHQPDSQGKLSFGTRGQHSTSWRRIARGIDAKHSTRTPRALRQWIALYGKRIGLLGGIDVNAYAAPAEVVTEVVEKGTRFRQTANGYALGSGADRTTCR